MRRAWIAALLLAAGGAGDEPQDWRAVATSMLRDAGFAESDLAVKDREILRADERHREQFPELEPHLLPAVREALDRPLELPGRCAALAASALAAASGHAALEQLAAFAPHPAHPPPDAPAPGAKGAPIRADGLPDAAALTVGELRDAAVDAARGVVAWRDASHGPEGEALLRAVLPTWLSRTTPEDVARATKGEEDADARTRMGKAAALILPHDVREMQGRALRLVEAVERALPALRSVTEWKNTHRVETEFGPVVLRGTGNDAGDADALLLVDFGGDDEYTLPAAPEDRPARILIDLSGHDLYLSKAPLSWGAAMLGVSVLVDVDGDDDYRGGDWSLGCGLGGVGILWDRGGRDRYYGGLGAEGAGVLGVGVLLDDAGDDEYVAGCFGQGFGSTGGVGAILDRAGNDAYTAGRDEEDRWRRPATYVTFAQGAAFGHRFGAIDAESKGERRWRITGQVPGGVGLLLDGAGDDRYEADVFGQGAAYWYSLGILVDRAGRDRYRATWYGQGVGTHAAAGCVVDLDGDDWYFSRNTSQGCGHDFSVGVLHDRAGNDAYTGVALCQGAGNAASGLGLLIDESGDDAYRCSGDGWGFGSTAETHPEAAPFGLFLDLGGKNRFEGAGPARPGTTWARPPRGLGRG